MKTLLTALLAAALFASAAATPSRAMEAEQIGGILAGLLTLGLIAKAIDDRNDRVAPATHAAPDLTPPARSKHAGRFSLPDRCLSSVDGRRQERLVYGGQCLKRIYPFADRLPSYCERKLRTDRGWRTVYGARCLDRAGFEVATLRDWR